MDKPTPISNIDNDMSPSESGNVDIVETLHQTFNKMFTKEHLETDTYLRPHLSSQLSLPVDVVVEAPLVRSITTDRHTIEHALRTSNSVVMMESTVRPNIKVEQHTIILRDVSSDVSEANIIDMFRAANCEDIIDCRSEMNKTWFVTFATEDAARNALINIRSSKLGDNPVRARLKTESIIRSYYQPGNRSADSSQAKPTPDSAPAGSGRPQAIATDIYNSGGQIPSGPSSGRGRAHQNGTHPAIPQMGYYMYPHYGHVPMPGGNPMFMGGMWPMGMPPMMPVMPMMQHHHSSVSGGRGGGGRGRHNKSSPRNYHQGGGGGGGKGAPNSPNGQRPRGNSYGSKGHTQQGQQLQPHHTSPYAAYGHMFHMTSPDGREHMAGPMTVAYDVMGNPIMHMAVTPPAAVDGDDTKGKALKEGGEEGLGKGDKNKKKNVKNKKKDKSTATGATTGGTAASTTGAGGQDAPSSGEGGQHSGERKGKGDGGSKGSSTHRDREQSGGGRSEGGGRGGGGEKRSPRGGRGGAKGDGKTPKVQPDFNMEADFPTLGLNAHGNAAHASAGGVSWAAAIMKAPVENVPQSCALEEGTTCKASAAIAAVSPQSALTDTALMQTGVTHQQTQIQQPKETNTQAHGGDTTIDYAEAEAAGVVFGDATAWIADSSACVTCDSEKTASPTPPLHRPTGDLPISPGGHTQLPASAHSEMSPVATIPPEQSKPVQVSTEERPFSSPPKSGGDTQKRSSKGSTARSRDGPSSTSPERNGTAADKGEIAAEPCVAPPGKAWGANAKMSFLDVKFQRCPVLEEVNNELDNLMLESSASP